VAVSPTACKRGLGLGETNSCSGCRHGGGLVTQRGNERDGCAVRRLRRVLRRVDRPQHQHGGRHGVAVGARRTDGLEVSRLQRRRGLGTGHTGQRRHRHVRLPTREHHGDRRALLLRYARLRALRHHAAGGHDDGRHRYALLQGHMDLVHAVLAWASGRLDHRRRRMDGVNTLVAKAVTSPAARITARAAARRSTTTSCSSGFVRLWRAPGAQDRITPALALRRC